MTQNVQEVGRVSQDRGTRPAPEAIIHARLWAISWIVMVVAMVALVGSCLTMLVLLLGSAPKPDPVAGFLFDELCVFAVGMVVSYVLAGLALLVKNSVR